MTKKSGESHRIASLDLLRGLVMVLMALDHARVFLTVGWNPLDLSVSSVPWFLTRWITHFCAPVFVFLAGLSAALLARKLASRAALARYLLSRGLILVLLELTVVNFSWQFGYHHVSLLVIWVLGWSMVGLAALVLLPPAAPLACGLLLVLGHNLVSSQPAASFGALGPLFGILFRPCGFELFGLPVGVSYPLLPWLGVMALGYACAPLLAPAASPHRPGRAGPLLGAALVLLFLVARGLQLYGEPTSWSVQERGAVFTVLSFLNLTKYPPSLQYLLMTMGPSLLVLPLLARWRGRAAGVVQLFGRVPLFFYLLHLPVLHLVGALWRRLAGAPEDVPELVPVFAAWLLVTALLYPACAWYDRHKRQRRWGWMRYF